MASPLRLFKRAVLLALFLCCTVIAMTHFGKWRVSLLGTWTTTSKIVTSHDTSQRKLEGLVAEHIPLSSANGEALAKSARNQTENLTALITGLSAASHANTSNVYTAKTGGATGLDTAAVATNGQLNASCHELLDKVGDYPVTREGWSFSDQELLAGDRLPKTDNAQPRIPHILHQTWDTYMIPEAAVPWVQSILKHHPQWQYWFWTQADVQCYLKHKHSDYVKLYNSYFSMIFKTDVMRYFLLYDYGGIYLDLDVSCLKPLDFWTYVAPAVLSHETYEHSFVMHRRNVPNVMTTILATRPGHPYYKMLQENLDQYHKMMPSDVLHSTGPYFLDDIYNKYNATFHKNRPKSKSVMKPILGPNSTLTHLDDNDILVIHPKYWLPTQDKMDLSKICSCDLLRDGVYKKPGLNERILRNADTLQLCNRARDKGFTNVPDAQSFLDHHWIHTNIGKNAFKVGKKVDIRKLIPDLVPVPKRIGINC